MLQGTFISHASTAIPCERIELIIADHSETVRHGLSGLLSDQGVRVVGKAASAEKLRDLLEWCRANVVIFNCGNCDDERVALTRELVEKYPTINIVIFKTAISPYLIYRLLQAGARGVLPQEATIEQIVSAITAVSKGRLVLEHPYASHILLAALNGRLTQLTERELMILEQVVRGATNKEISALFCIAAKTVETHISNICLKLSVRSRTEAAVYAIQMGIVQPF